MSNIMSQVKLKNKTSRNAFDLSRRNAFTAKVGELLPVACIECIPGDKFKARTQHFTRTVPVNTAAYTRIREYYDWFFVPTNLLWNKFNSFITNMGNNIQHANSTQDVITLSDKHPYFTAQQLYDSCATLSNYTNMFGYQRGATSSKLLEFLGYGDYFQEPNVNANLNPFPLMAYQKIYQDYFRNSQWEDAYAPAFNVDYVSNTPQINLAQVIAPANTRETMLDLRYCNWNKDLFFGLQPNSQYGETASIFVTNPDIPSVDRFNNLSMWIQKTNNAEFTSTDSIVIGENAKGGSQKEINIAPLRINNRTTGSGINLITLDRFTILALRQAEALQKWKEITQSQQQDYKNQIEAHFGVTMSDAYSERCRYIDGSVSNLDISEVPNNNITADNAANIAGKGVGVGDSIMNFSTDVHGYLMCIYHAVPLLDYSTSGIARRNLKTMFTDYAIPELDATGMVSVPMVELSNTKDLNVNGRLLGYAPRYYDYKTAIDEVHGGFKQTLASWTAPVSDDYLTMYVQNQGTYSNVYNYRFLKVNPGILNPIFGVDADADVATDQLLVNSAFDITAVRNLDRNGLPY